MGGERDAQYTPAKRGDKDIVDEDRAPREDGHFVRHGKEDKAIADAWAPRLFDKGPGCASPAGYFENPEVIKDVVLIVYPVRVIRDVCRLR